VSVRSRALWLALHLVPFAAIVVLRIAGQRLPDFASFVAFALLVIAISAGQAAIVREAGWGRRTAIGMLLLIGIAFAAVALADRFDAELFGIFAGHAVAGIAFAACQRRGVWLARAETGFIAGAAFLTALYASDISVAGPVIAFPGFVELAGIAVILPFYSLATVGRALATVRQVK
jgi:hypothetical protein